ncbi:MAG: response regulator [Planctomycetota bacterium]
MVEDKINLLIVDDETRFLISMAKRLEQRGFHVTAVDRGEKALEAARQAPVDIALVDLKMPGMGGEETLEALKKEHEWMEVIILTGHGSVDSAVECTRSGAYSYLQKPCEFEELLNELASAYKKRMMNKMKLDKERMDAVLGLALTGSPLGILRRLKELDRKGK